MTQEKAWKRDEVVEHLKSPDRRLDIICPPLRSYLTPGMKVLDVGCGPGPITLDVAEAVYPGEVVGIDGSETSIAHARTAAKAAQCPNVSFQIGDTYTIDFADGTFDAVYSTNVFVWLQEPVRALIEQRRVTRSGGWVLAHLADYGNVTFYPSCPALDHYLATLAQFRELGNSQNHIDSHQARRAIELMSQAGFSEIQIQGWPKNMYHNKEGFAELYSQWRDGWLSMNSTWADFNGSLIAAGLLNKQTLLDAQEQLDHWYHNPYAFYTQTYFLAAGRA
jgi:ubiquinone/menaquinone biosynthesis C-methylase UbiE